MEKKVELLDAYELAAFIKNAKKATPVKAYIKGQLELINFEGLKVFGEGNSRIVFGESGDIEKLIETNAEKIQDYVVENDRRNSAIPLLDMKKLQARIEPGAIIREHVKIGKNAVIMMGGNNKHWGRNW